jgi:hypothetical protein
MSRQFLGQEVDLPFDYITGSVLIVNYESGDRFWMKSQYGIGKILISPGGVAIVIVISRERRGL